MTDEELTDEELTDEELVKALRDTYDLVKMWPEKRPDGFTNLLVLRNLVPDAADRIEQLQSSNEALERELEICRMAQVVMENTVADAEARLAKAVEALRLYACACDGGFCHANGNFCGGDARATLAEIEGGKDD